MKYLVFLVFLAVSTCTSDVTENIKTIESSKFCEELHANSTAQLLDVRTPEEYQEGHISEATLANIKNEKEFLDVVATLDKNEPVFVYCRSGKRSSMAAGHLANNGFKHIIELENGISSVQAGDDCIVIEE